MNEAHEQVADGGTVQGLIEEGDVVYERPCLLLLCPLLAKSGHNINAEMMPLGR